MKNNAKFFLDMFLLRYIFITRSIFAQYHENDEEKSYICVFQWESYKI